MLKNAVTTLTADPGTALYIDGGHSPGCRRPCWPTG